MTTPDIVQRITELERRLDGLGLPEIGAQATLLTSPLTNTNFDGDSFSDVGSNTKIDNADWSTTIPANAKALILRCYCRDSGSAGTAGLYVAFYATAAGTENTMSVWPSGKDNDDYAEQCAVVPCTDGDIWYRVNASGASTMDIWLLVWGYFI